MYNFDDVSKTSVACQAVTVFVEDGEILDVRFIDELELLVLLKARGT
jgi:hypothetical protein